MSPATAAWLARAAREAYLVRSPEHVGPGATLEYLEVANFEVVSLRCAEHLVLAFRGSDERLDWKYNLRFGPVADERMPGRWHRGFLAGGKAVLAELVPHLARHSGPVWLVGHSLGSALAGVVAALLLAGGRADRIAGVLQLGAPRFCTVSASRWLSEGYAGRWLRVVNAQDRVPHLPPAVLGFRHVGEKFNYTPTDVSRPWWAFLRPWRFLGDHKVTRYVAALEQRAAMKHDGPEGLAGGVGIPARC